MSHGQIGQGGKYPGQAGDLIGQTPQSIANPAHGFASIFIAENFDPRKVGSDRIDENAVRRIAYLMQQKMQAAAAKGKSGWWTCKDSDLEVLLAGAMGEQDWVSAANYAMMLQIKKEIRNSLPDVVLAPRR